MPNITTKANFKNNATRNYKNNLVIILVTNFALEFYNNDQEDSHIAQQYKGNGLTG